MSSETSHMRQHILDTAKPIILGKGFSAVGLNEILAAAEVPKGSFYHYFKSKEAFGAALLDSYFTGYLQQLEQRLSPEGLTQRKQFLQYWELWRETQSNDDAQAKCLVVKLGAEVCDLSEAMRDALEHGTHRIIERLADCLRQGIALGDFPSSVDPQSTALNLYNLWLGASLISKIRHDRSAFDAAMSATLQLLGACRSLGCESEKMDATDQNTSDSQANSCSIGQEAGGVWAEQPLLQPQAPKSYRLPGPA